MQLNTYLNFKGQCKAAFEFYERVLGGKIEAMMTHGETPAAEHVTPEWRDTIMHASMVVGDNVLMGSDAPLNRDDKPAGFYVSLQIPDPAEAERIFHALAENGTVHMPIQETFWAARFGMLADQFDIPWMINCDKAS